VRKKNLWLALALLSVQCFAQQTIAPFKTQQANTVFYVNMGAGTTLTTIQKTVTAACAYSTATVVDILPGSNPSDTIAGLTSACTNTRIFDQRVSPADNYSCTSGGCTLVPYSGPTSAVTDNILINSPSTGLYFANTDSIGLLVVGGFPELLAGQLGIPTGNRHINAIGSASLADMLSCNTPGTGNCTQNGTWPLTFPLGVTSNSKALLEAAYNDVSNIGGAPNAAQSSYYGGGLKAWMLEFGIPDSQKLAANSSICTTTGTWTTVSAVPGTSSGVFPAGTLQTLTPGATITCTTRNATDAGFIGYKSTGSTTATMTISAVNAGVTYNIVDPYTGSTTLNQNAPYTSFWGGTANLYAVGQAGMAGGYTTITLTAANNSSDPVIVSGVYFLSPSSSLQNYPAVEMMLESRAGCNGACSSVAGPQHDDANTNVMRGIQIATVNELRSNGLNISYYDPNATPPGYNSSDPAQTADGTHPNGISSPFLANVGFVNLNSAATTQDHFLPVVAGNNVTVPTTPNFLNAPSGILTAVQNIFPVVVGGGNSFNGIGIQGGTGLTSYLGTVAQQQQASTLNTFFNGANWPYTQNGILAAFRILNSSGSDSAFQVSVCPTGTAGSNSNMDTICVAQYTKSGTSNNQTWFNSRAGNPTFPTNAALCLNPSCNWMTDFSGNETAASVTTPSASVQNTTVAGDVTTFDNTTGHLHDSGIPSSTLASTALTNSWPAAQDFSTIAATVSINNEPGLQIVSVAGCAIAAGTIGTFCAATITMSTPEPDTGYEVSGCSFTEGTGSTGPLSMGSVFNKTTTTFEVSLVAPTTASANTASAGAIICMVTHP
jgi:hypothetical protein